MAEVAPDQMSAHDALQPPQDVVAVVRQALGEVIHGYDLERVDVDRDLLPRLEVQRDEAGPSGPAVVVRVPVLLHLQWPIFEIVAGSPLPVRKYAFQASSDRARRAGLDALSSVCFHIRLKSLAREKGTNKRLGLAVFLVKQGNQPRPNWVI